MQKPTPKTLPLTNTPLAERVRPTSIDQVIGQTHLLGQNAPLSQLIASGKLPSLILHGEAGIGKTTLARLLAEASKRTFHALSAINTGVKQLREVLDAGVDGLLGAPVVFIDEIHRFNKAQQDALLHAVETGQITLIGATTENPSFSVNNALLSRCQIYRLKPLSDEEIEAVIRRAIQVDATLSTLDIEVVSLKLLTQLASSDARKALNLLEMAVAAQAGQDSKILIDDEQIASIAQEALVRYDKTGEGHYDTISAMIKSVRGSDPDAALYWMALMLVAGEDAAFIARRLVILASEDIGNANPNALLLADAALRSVQQIGMPEARIILGQVCVYLATSPKSNSTYKAINAAMALAAKHQYAVPLHLRNGVTSLMKSEGYGKGYQYAHDYPNHYAPQEHLPDELIGHRFYKAADNPKEQASQAWLDKIKSGF